MDLNSGTIVTDCKSKIALHHCTIQLPQSKIVVHRCTSQPPQSKSNIIAHANALGSYPISSPFENHQYKQLLNRCLHQTVKGNTPNHHEP